MKKKIIIMVLMLVSIAFAGCIEEDIVEDEEEDSIEYDDDFDETLNVTVYRISDDFLYCTNQIKYKIGFPINTSEYDYLIGKQLTINVSYDQHYESTGKTGSFRFMYDKEAKGCKITGENVTIRKAYDQYISYLRNLYHLEELEITGDTTIDLPVLDRYGRNIHYIKEIEIIIYNPSNASTYLKTNFSYYNCGTTVILNYFPPDLVTRYFVLDYPEQIVVGPYETVCYPFTIEIYGSGAEQIFFPKEYKIGFVISNEYLLKSFSLEVSLTEYD